MCSQPMPARPLWPAGQGSWVAPALQTVSSWSGVSRILRSPLGCGWCREHPAMARPRNAAGDTQGCGFAKAVGCSPWALEPTEPQNDLLCFWQRPRDELCCQDLPSPWPCQHTSPGGTGLGPARRAAPPSLMGRTGREGQVPSSTGTHAPCCWWDVVLALPDTHSSPSRPGGMGLGHAGPSSLSPDQSWLRLQPQGEPYRSLPACLHCSGSRAALWALHSFRSVLEMLLLWRSSDLHV